jgi:hypothetical protein
LAGGAHFDDSRELGFDSLTRPRVFGAPAR